MRKMRNTYGISIGKPQKRLLGIPVRGNEDTIKMDIRDMTYEGMIM
jgi:hypothetical protein